MPSEATSNQPENQPDVHVPMGRCHGCGEVMTVVFTNENLHRFANMLLCEADGFPRTAIFTKERRGCDA